MCCVIECNEAGSGADVLPFGAPEMAEDVRRRDIVRVEYKQTWVPGQPPVRVMAECFPDGHVEFWGLDFGDVHWWRLRPTKRDIQSVSERLQEMGRPSG
jgi:hypothetical protein